MRVFLSLLCLLTATGCQSKLLLVPPEGAEVITDIRVFEKTDNRGFSRPLLLDNKYLIVDDKFALELIGGIAFLRKYLNFKYKKNSNDCDNHAKLFVAVFTYVFRHSKAEPIIFVVLVKQEYKWAGIRAGGHHALVAVFTTEGFRVVEPNSAGISCLLKDYPNKDYIYKLL